MWGAAVTLILVGAAVLMWGSKRGSKRMVPLRGTPTAEMTEWAKEIVRVGYPFGTTIPRSFNGRMVIARVEHHTKQESTGKTGDFRGVTLYEPDPQV